MNGGLVVTEQFAGPPLERHTQRVQRLGVHPSHHGFAHELVERLARAIRARITANGWKQQDAAKALGLAQSDVSDLVRGKLRRFSLQRLHAVLARPTTGGEP